jgi:hypothetical protein
MPLVLWILWNCGSTVPTALRLLRNRTKKHGTNGWDECLNYLSRCAGETGKEYGVRVSDDTRSSEPYRPQAVRRRSRDRGRSVGRGVHRPTNRAAKGSSVQSADAVGLVRKATWMRTISRARTQLCVVVGAGMCIRSLSGSRESSELAIRSLMVRVGKTMSRSR